MRKLPMKKLLLIPTVVMTGFLAFAFLMPTTAANVVKSVAPVAHLNLNSVFSASSGNEAAAQPASTGTAPSSAAPAGSSPSNTSSSPSGSLQPSTSLPLISTQDRGHEVATAGDVNCGRYGNGHHGGKHDFTCPNRPFPEPVS
jgi:hypothetical protein